MKRNPKFVIYVTGGLGNQLFCYFYARWVADYYGAKFEIDLLYASRSHSTRFSLASFCLDEKIKTPRFNAFKKLRLIQWKLLDSIIFRFPHSGIRLMKWLNIYREGSNESLSFEKFPKAKIMGFFQDSNYFLSLREKGVFDGFELVNPSTSFLHWSNIANLIHPVTIHIRRGDFFLNSSTYGVLSPDFYRDALDILENRLGVIQDLWVFSDDKLVVQNWEFLKKPGRNVIFFGEEATADSNEKMDPAEDLLLMTYARGMVLANSSFSLFGALLNRNGPVVVAPSTTARLSKLENPNFYPPSFIRAPADWVLE